MKFVPIPQYMSLPDGRIRIGPLTGGLARIRIALGQLQLRLSSDAGLPVYVSPHLSGIILSCAGAGVRGYLLDHEGDEAPSSDIDTFMEMFTPKDVTCRILGHYRFEQDSMIESEALYWRGHSGVEGSERRELIRSNGQRLIIGSRVSTRRPSLHLTDHPQVSPV